MSNALSEALRDVLPKDAAASWAILRDILPKSMTLFGGTAIAVHLHHRVSRDLDFFFDDPTFDLDALKAQLESLRPTAVTYQDKKTLNALFGETKIQFLSSTGQRDIQPATNIEGIQVAGLRDLAATKMKVVADRGELRDYFDIMVIEQRTSITTESALLDYEFRYNDTNPNNVIGIVRGLGYLGDVIDDPGLPVTRDSIETYWQSRQIGIIESLDSTGYVVASTPPPVQHHQVSQANPQPASWGEGKVWVEPHTRNGRHVDGYWRRR